MKGLGGDDEESSDSDHRRKRRKVNPMHHHLQNDGPQTTANAQPAAPNSFAAKMMAKMGYKEGQGLGASGKGRLAPIDAQLRPQGAGLGVVKEKTKQAKEEEKREAGFRGQVVEDSSEEERKRKKERREKKKTGAISGSGTPRAQAKPKYRTAAEIEAAAEGLEIPSVLKSIIDATGPETRLLSSSAGLLRAQDAMVPAETKAMKLSRLAQRESIAFAEEWRALQEREDFMKAQESELKTSLSRAADQQLDELIAVVETLQGISVDQNTNWELIIRQLESISDVESAADGVINVHDVAIAAIHPIFKTTLLHWDPLEDPRGCVSYLERVKDILRIVPKSNEIALRNGNMPPASRYKSTTPYETMIYTLWLPVVRSAISRWNVQKTSQMMSMVEAWMPVLPEFIVANVIDQLIEQRLADEIKAWKSKRTRETGTQATPPHIWLFPWFQYLDVQHTDPRSSHGLINDIKRKLKGSFSTWNIGHGVFPDLDKWRSIFKTDLTHMLVRYILPRLAEYFTAQFDVDPADQDMKAFEKVLQWVPHFSVEVIAQLFTDVFFKKWHNILYLWLVGEPDHTEIMQWYQWWKLQIQERLPQGFNELPITASCWEKGLTIINVALDAIERDGDVGAELQTVMFPADKMESIASSTPKPAIPIQQHVDIPTTFKDVVEDWCAENGLLMVPLREADLQTGLPLFRITASASGKGGVVLYLRGDVAWVRTITDGEKSFVPMGLDDALVARTEG